MSELISVIILTYNSANTICETLDSVKSQTYPDIEMIISDDCSKDDTIGVVEKWLSENGEGINYKVIKSNKNSGVASNCNRGIAAAQGIYLKFLAGDDCLDKNAIEKFYCALKSTENKVIFQSKVVLIDENSEELPDSEYIKKNYEILARQGCKQTRLLLKGNFLIAPAMGLFDKRIIGEFGGFDEQIPNMEDAPFYIKLSLNGYKFVLLDENLVYYRIHSKSLTGGYSLTYEGSAIKYFFKLRFKEQLKHFMIFTALKQFIRYTLRYMRYLYRKRKSKKK